MYKKSLILVSVILFVLCICSGFVSATNEVKNAVSNVTNTVVDGVNHLGSDVRNGVGAAENGIEGALDMNNGDNKNTTTNNNRITTTNDYAVTRTTTDAMTNNGTSNLWIWLIVGIAAIMIIGLVWYYGTQNRTHHDE